MLAAIKGNASALLDSAYLGKLNALPDDGVHEQAVGLGLAEIRTLFGDFTSADQIRAAVEKLIDIEHGRFSALLAINGADDAASMATALSFHIALLNQHRQNLIAQWSASGDPDAVARAAELSGDVYTRVLNEINSHLDSMPYLSELAARLLAARQNGPLHDIESFIAAIDAADEAIDATHDAVISGTDSGFMSEDDLGSIGGALIVADEDWGESTFKPVAAGDLQKQYGAFTFNSATGQWSFTLNGNAQALKQDQQVQQMLLVESLDGTATRTIIVTIIGRNDAPVAAVDGNSVSGLEDTAIAGQVPAGTDVDGDSLTYALLDPVDGLTFHEDGTFSYVPAVDFKGNVTFRYRVLDGNGGASQPQTFTIKVGTVNDAPHDILLSNTRVKENAKAGAIVGTLTGLDVDGDALTFSLLDNAGGRFAISNGQLVVKDGVRLDYEQATTHTVTIRVTDASQESYTETFLIGLDNVTGESIDGSSASDLLMGDSGKDVIKGGSGDDTVHGSTGNDTLWGGLGNDTLTGGKGKDVFVFDSKLGTSSTDRKVNFDTIKDFSVKDDRIYLDNAIFKKLGSGTPIKPKQLSKSFFTIGDKAKDKNDYVIYNDKTGVLSYDADGSGKGKAIEIAQLSKKLTTITYKDFFVI